MPALPDPKPFRRRAAPRPVVRPDLPAGIRLFHAGNDVFGLESTPERDLRLARPEEIKRVQWPDLWIARGDPPPAGGFAAFCGWRIGVDSSFAEIVLMAGGLWGPPGAILAVGPSVAGPAGPPADPAEQLEVGLVLTRSFVSWVAHLETTGWMEYGLFPGALADLPAPERTRQKAYYRRLNPHAVWAQPE